MEMKQFDFVLIDLLLLTFSKALPFYALNSPEAIISSVP